MDWLDTNDAATALEVKAERLRKLRRGGWLKESTHYRSLSDPSVGKPRWQFHVKNLNALFSTNRRFWKKYE